MKALHTPTLTRQCTCVLLPFAIGVTALLADDSVENTPDQTSPNYIIFDVTGTDLSGSKPAWRARTEQESYVRGGIEAIHYETDLAEDWFFTLEGRGILDENDYSLEATFEKAGFNRTRIGFETFRTWSDAHTVELPGSGVVLTPFDPSLSLDRSKFFIESTFTPEDGLAYTFRYTLRTREGEKASTRWADAVVNAAGDRRKVVPSFLDIDEVHHTVELEVDRRMDQTNWDAALRWDHRDYENALRFVEYPPGGDSAIRTTSYTAQEEDWDSDTVSGRTTVEHRVSKKLTLNASAMVSQLNGDVSTTRIEGDSFYPSLLTGDLDHDVEADFDLDQYVVTFSALYQPAQNWLVTPSLRFERTEQDAEGVVDPTDDPVPTKSRDYYDDVAAELGLRYTGIRNWTLYTDALATHTEGDLFERGGSREVDRETDYDRNAGKLTVGANWYAHRIATVAFQAYHKETQNDYNHSRDEEGGAVDGPGSYSAFITRQEHSINDFNIRLNWRPLPNLTSITRFDYQRATIDTDSAATSKIESADHERFIYSENLTYQPCTRLTLTGSINYVEDTLTTPASDAFTDESSALVAEGQMDYLTAQLTGVYLYNDTTDITVSAMSLLSDNYYDNSSVSVPYGNDLEEFSISAAIGKWLTPNKRVTLQYSYYDHDDGATAGDADFSVHVVSAKFEYRF